MNAFDDSNEIARALRLVGELLAARGVQHHIVIIGGAAVNLLGVVSRATTDVDILAFAIPDATGAMHLQPPDDPLPETLVEAAETVAEDLGLDPHWLNIGPASQWKTGLPPGLEGRVTWQRESGLSIGIVSRRDLVFFKLYAAVDDTGTRSVHFQDLVALGPSEQELTAAAEWVRRQDPSPVVQTTIEKVIEHVRARR